MDKAQKSDIASWCLAGIALIAVLKFGLLAALLSGLLVYQLIRVVTPSLRMTGATLRTRKAIALALFVSIVALLIVTGALKLATLIAGGPTSIVVLMQKMADLLDTARAHFPLWIQEYLPADAAEFDKAASNWLRGHAGELKTAGETVGRTLLHVVIGIVIGVMIAFSDSSHLDKRPLARALVSRASMLGAAFRRIAYAQVRISGLNTLLTAIYLLVLLPLSDVHLPLVKTMIAVTFIAGLMPIVGNLISNTVIVIVSLSASLGAAVASLVYLVVIHKLEYLVNAQIIGTQIRARAWELLLAMLVMEALFGLPGLIAAPVYYAYLKDELAARELI